MLANIGKTARWHPNATAVAGVVACVLVLAGAAPRAAAQESAVDAVTSRVSWNVYVNDDPRQCWVDTSPIQSRATRNGKVVSVNRGSIRLQVSYWANAAGRGEVSFLGGYTFKTGESVWLDIGDTRHLMFTDEKIAWSHSPESDARIIDDMKRGLEAVVTGKSNRGTTTTDTFSLLGFTAAIKEAAARCAG